MLLVDTSVWVDFLRRWDEGLSQLLSRNQVYMHPMIIGELSCVNLQNRQQLMDLWQKLPTVIEASHKEVLFFLESNHLMGQGIGFVDLHLLVSTRLTNQTQLWTRDKRLTRIAESLNIGFFED